MKTIYRLPLLILVLLFSGCSTSPSSGEKTISRKATVDSIYDSRCLDSKSFIVESSSESGIFAKHCPKKFKSYHDDTFDACASSPVFFLAIKKVNNDYADNEKVTLRKNECLIKDGIYEYVSHADSMTYMALIATNPNLKKRLPGPKKTRVRKLKIIKAN